MNHAQINILATADNHGRIDRLPQFWQTVEQNIDRIFPPSSHSVNVLAVAGDWFINPAQQPFLSQNTLQSIGLDLHSEKIATAGHYSTYFLNKFIKSVEEKTVNQLSCIYLIGNHCLDNGDETFYELSTKFTDSTECICSNLNFAQMEARYTEKFASSSIVKTSINNRTFKALFVGLSPTNLKRDKSQEKNILYFLDETKKTPDRLDLDRELQESFNSIKALIEDFKAKDPHGAVVVLNHMGNPVAMKLVEVLDNEGLKADLILNGHDHKDSKIYSGKNNTPIVSLGENNEKFEVIKLIFKDNEVQVTIDNTYYIPDGAICEDNLFEEALRQKMPLDYIPDVSVHVADKTLQILTYKGAKYENNHLANFLTGAVLEQIKEHMPECEIFGISPVYIRGDLPINGTNINNFSIINLFTAHDDQFKINTSELTGEEITRLIVETVVDNNVNRERFSLMQWAGLQFDIGQIRSVISAKYPLMSLRNVKEHIDSNKFAGMIKILQNGFYTDMDGQKRYTTAVTSYPLFSKKFPLLIEKAETFKNFSVDRSAKHLFYDFINKNGKCINLPDLLKDVRIIDSTDCD